MVKVDNEWNILLDFSVFKCNNIDKRGKIWIIYFVIYIRFCISRRKIMKLSLKQLLREPIKLILFILLISASTIFIIMQSMMFRKSMTELNSIYESYDVVGTVAVASNYYIKAHETPMEDRKDSTLFSYEDILPIINSEYVEVVDARRVLAGYIPGVRRLCKGGPFWIDDLFIGIGDIADIDDEGNKYFKVKEKWFGFYEEVGDALCIQHKTKIIINATEDPDFDGMKLGESYLIALRRNHNGKYYIDTQHGVCLQGSIDEKISEDMSTETFMNSPFQFLASSYLYNHVGYSFQILYTKDLLHIPDFHNGKVELILGRDFTKEEYQEGRKVCIISREMAIENQLEIGDKLAIQLTDMLGTDGTAHKSLQYVPYSPSSISLTTGKPRVVYSFMLPPEEYEVVGIYQRYNGNYNDPYYFDNNTIFVPDTSWDLSAYEYDNDDLQYSFQRHSYRRNAFSFVLKSPEVKDEFLKQIEADGFPMEDLEITFIDGGLYLVADTLSRMKDSALLILVFAVIVLIVVTLLTAFFFIAKKKKEYSCMRLLGLRKGRCNRILIGSLLLIGIVGIVIGSISASIIAPNYFAKMYQEQSGEAFAENLLVDDNTIIDTDMFYNDFWGPQDPDIEYDWVEEAVDYDAFSPVEGVLIGIGELVLLLIIGSVVIYRFSKESLLLMAKAENE